MTPREKIAHLLRRFGLGASVWELDRYEPLGVEGTLNRLLDYEKVGEGFPISPWEICHEPDKAETYVDSYRIGAWWALRMVMSQRPLEQKLALFWHDHFAVSGAKVEFGPMMLTYLETLRKNASGDFGTLLREVSKEPAMVRYLDTDASFKDDPNENFARELLELFTLGIGHYTQKDITETARAFTGWGNRYLIFESGGEKAQERIKDSIKRDLPMIAFASSPALHDGGPKTILGSTAAYDGDSLLAFLAKRPETARHVTGKLWEFFATPSPSAGVRDRLAVAFGKTGDIKAVLRQIAAEEEFWSEKCVRQRVKSPVDFVVGILRALNLHGILLGLHGKPAGPTTPLPKPLRDVAGLVWYTMSQQGLGLLFPPDVGGWKWGTAWITATNLAERLKFGDLILGVGQKDQAIAAYLAGQIRARQPANSEEAIVALLTLFDASLSAEKRALVVQAFEKQGGVSSLAAGPSASKSLSAACRLVFGSPEFQMV